MMIVPQVMFDKVEHAQYHADYCLIDPESNIAQHLSTQSEDIVANLGFELDGVIKEQWPPLMIPVQWRKYSSLLKNYGNVKGGKFLITALKKKVAKGEPNKIVLKKNLFIKENNGSIIMPLSAEILVPRCKSLLVKENNDGTVQVSLRNVPKKKQQVNEGGLEGVESLQEYKKYTKKRFQPHR